VFFSGGGGVGASDSSWACSYGLMVMLLDMYPFCLIIVRLT
jgi:hypothetical protein